MKKSKTYNISHMDFNIIPLAGFLKDLKSMSKIHRSIVKDVDHLALTLKNFPDQGIAIGKGCYKIRLAISSKGKGKSGGWRVITCVKVVQQTVYLLAIMIKVKWRILTMMNYKIS